MTVAGAEHIAALQEILMLDASACTVEVCIASLQSYNPLPQFRRLRLAQSLKDTFQAIVTSLLTEYYKDLRQHNLNLLEFDVASKPADYEIEYLDLTKKPYDHILEQIRPLHLLYGLDTFREEPAFIEGMRFYVIVLQPPQGQPVYFYRNYTPKKMLRGSSQFGITRMFSDTDEYEDVKTPIFLFDKYIDCISRGSDLFVLSKEHFYYMFRILDELIQSAKDTLDLIQKCIPIENFRLFARACTHDKRKMQKLTSIARRPYLGSITIAEMLPVIQEHRLHIPVIEVNGQEMLHFDERHPWDILKLLDDDYLRSIMTGQRYTIDAKRNP